MKLIDGYFTEGDHVNVLTVTKGVKLPAENCTVIVTNIYDRAIPIRLPFPEDAVGLFYCIVLLPNPTQGAATADGVAADVIVSDGRGVTIDTFDVWGHHAIIWSDGFYFHTLMS